MKVLKNNDIKKNEWGKFLANSSFSSPFQTIEFYNLYRTSESFDADVFAVEEDGSYRALVVVTIQKETGIKSIFSKRGIIYGGPLLINSNANGVYLDQLLYEIKSYYKRKIIYLEVRNSFDYSALSSIYTKRKWDFQEHLNVQLNIDGEDVESLLSKMKYNRRREIRISIEEGATMREANNEEEVVALFEILKNMYEENVKLPVWPLPFFINLYKSAIGKVFIVQHDDKIIGGSFCVYYDNMSINTLYYVGLKNYHKKIFPTHLAVMMVIEFGVENNLKLVDFMGAGKPNISYGVRDYKLKFGGDLVEHGRFSYILKPILYKIGLFGVKLMGKIKI